MNFRINELLAERGIPKAEFARKLNIKPQALDSMLKHDRPSIDSMVTCARTLNVPIWETVYGCGIDCVGIELEAWKTEQPTFRIKRMMQEKNMTQKDLAKNMGVTAASVSLTLSNGQYNLSTLIAFAKGLDVPVWELFISRENMEKEIARRKALRGEPVTASSEPKPSSFSSVDDKKFNSMRHYFEMEKQGKEAAQTPARSMNDSDKEPDLFDTIAEDAEETEMISVAESKRRMRKALQLLLDNLGRIRPETLDRIVEQACK